MKTKKPTPAVMRHMAMYTLGVIHGIQYENRDWPDELHDHWLTWSKEYDINIWIDSDEPDSDSEVQASVYHRTKSKTLDWWPLDLKGASK